MVTALQKCPPARLLLALTFSMIAVTTTRAQSFRVSIAPGLADSATQRGLDGRLLLLLSDNNKAEPRFQINDGATTQLVFGIDVENFKNGEAQLVGVNAFGYPLERLRNGPAGAYYVQVLLHKYEAFPLQNGHTVKPPMDRGEGQHWNLAPGNLYSTPVKIHF